MLLPWLEVLLPFLPVMHLCSSFTPPSHSYKLFPTLHNIPYGNRTASHANKRTHAKEANLQQSETSSALVL